MGGLIPLRDASPEPKRYPMVTTSLIVVNVLVFLLELAGGKAFVRQWLVIPAEIAAGRHRITILAAMFMHTGWMHIIGNMVFLFHASETQFHTGWFVESLMTQTLVLFVIRTAKTPLESRPSGLLIATCLCSGRHRNLSTIQFVCRRARLNAPMPAAYFVYLSVATLVYLLIVEVAKGCLFRQAGSTTSTKVEQTLAVAT